jgi:hypothetical protein
MIEIWIVNESSTVTRVYCFHLRWRLYTQDALLIFSFEIGITRESSALLRNLLSSTEIGIVRESSGKFCNDMHLLSSLEMSIVRGNIGGIQLFSSLETGIVRGNISGIPLFFSSDWGCTGNNGEHWRPAIAIVIF